MQAVLEANPLSSSNILPLYGQLIFLQVITTSCSRALIRKNKVDPPGDQFLLPIQQT